MRLNIYDCGTVKMLFDKFISGIDTKDSYQGRVPLSYAAENGNIKALEFLPKQESVDVNSSDTYRRTALSWAAEKGYTEATRLLLKTNKVEVDLEDYRGQTPLAIAVRSGRDRMDVIRLLIEHNARVDARDDDGKTPLMWVIESIGETEFLELLVDHGANIEAKDSGVRTPYAWQLRMETQPL
jgi:ankyrin repeat protein